MQQGERHVDQFLGAQDEWARLECLLFKEGEVQAEVKGGGNVDSVVVQLQDVPLQLGQHLHGISVFEQFCNVLKLQDHLLVKFDADLKSNSANNSHESWLNRSIASQVIVSQMNCLQNGLVQAICLHCKLEDGQDCLFTMM